MVLEFMDRLHAALEVGSATYVECVRYVFDVVIPRCSCTYSLYSQDFEVTLPGFGGAERLAREHRLMLTLLAGLQRRSIVVCLERMRVPQLMGVSRSWRLRVNTPEPRIRKEAHDNVRC